MNDATTEPGLIDEILSESWFYRFPLPDGRFTESFIEADKLAFHDNRRDMMLGAVTRTFGEDLAGLRCLDLGAHQGYFAFSMARRGCAEVIGLEARAEHVARADLIRRAHGLANLSFRQGDATAFDPEPLDGEGSFDVVLMLGLVYHLDNPIGALRRAAAMSSRLIVVESQVMPNLSGNIDWGSYDRWKPLKGVFGVVEEGSVVHSSGITGVALVPSCEGLCWLLGKLGFGRVEVLPPPAGAYEQLLSGKRVMVAGWRD